MTASAIRPSSIRLTHEERLELIYRPLPIVWYATGHAHYGHQIIRDQIWNYTHQLWARPAYS